MKHTILTFPVCSTMFDNFIRRTVNTKLNANKISLSPGLKQCSSPWICGEKYGTLRTFHHTKTTKKLNYDNPRERELQVIAILGL